MKTRSLLSTAVVLLILITAVSCRKEGPGGKSSVTGLAVHHDTPIPGCVIYIKYNAKEFPGTDVSKYDASVVADGNARYEFKDLRRGDYYLYGVGYDANISLPVTGGVGVTLKYNKEKELNVPVTE
jgi:hypothetical protein